MFVVVWCYLLEIVSCVLGLEVLPLHSSPAPTMETFPLVAKRMSVLAAASAATNCTGLATRNACTGGSAAEASVATCNQKVLDFQIVLFMPWSGECGGNG